MRKRGPVLQQTSGVVIDTPEQFFIEAKSAGFGVVVTSFRENQLARLISQFEWGNKHLAADQTKSEEQIRKLISQKADNLCEEIGCASLVTKIEQEALQYNRTVIAAQKAGFE